MTRYALALAGLTLLMPAGALVAQDTEWNRYTLEKLAGVYPRIEAGAACEGIGVSAGSLRAETETILIEAEVPLLTEQEMLASPGLPELRVTVECAAGSEGLAEALGYSVGVRVQQAVQLIRDTQITHSEAITWYSTAVGVATPATAQETLRGAIRAGLEQFTTAFAAANEEGEGGR